MPTILAAALPSLNFARNPVVASFFNDTTPANTRTETVSVEIEIWVEQVFNSGTFTKISELSNPYNLASGQAKFNLSRSLLAKFNPSIPNPVSTEFQTLNGIVKRFKLKARDIVGGIPEGDFTESAIFIALMAGKSKEEGLPDLTGKAYLFLATRKTDKRIHTKETLHIDFLPLVSGNATVRVDWTTYNAEDYHATPIVAVTAFEPKGINIEIPNRETFLTMKVEIMGLVGEREIMEFNQVNYPVTDFSQIFYRNSMGGMETLAMIGLNEFNSTTKSDLFETEETENPSVSQGNSFSFNQSITDTQILRSGFLSKTDIRKCLDIPLRNEAYLHEDGLLKKLFIQPGTFKRYKDRDSLFSLDFQARFAYDNHSI